MRLLAPMEPRDAADVLTVTLVRVLYRVGLLIAAATLLGLHYRPPTPPDPPRHSFPIQVVETCPCKHPIRH